MSANNIQVAIKSRPLLKREKEQRLKGLWRIVDNSIHLDDSHNSHTDPFYFDHIFKENDQNHIIFNTMGKPIVDAALKGFNGTIFAYGQTASGKTYTMLGDEENRGVMVLAVKEIFNEIERALDRAFLLRVGYIEIYNEKIFDLLNPSNGDLKIHETPTGDVSVNCSEYIITSEEEMIDYLRAGSTQRRIGETNMNARSSRSHAIFRIIIESREIEKSSSDDSVQISHLNLVDLAGSERAVQTGATGSRLKEGGHINKSLLFLSCVIKQLSENETGYINYRDSKLTRILQASLGGNALTAVICTINPTAIDETQSTLSFAMRAKCIKNKPQVNEVLSDSAMMKRLEKEISRLRGELDVEKSKNSKIKVVQLERQIKEEVLKIISSHSLAPAKSTYNARRRRTWCPSSNMDNNDDSHMKTEFNSADHAQIAPKSHLPMPGKFFTPQISLRGDPPNLNGRSITPTIEENFVPGDQAIFPNSPSGFSMEFKTPESNRNIRHLKLKASLTPKLDIFEDYKKIEKEYRELQEYTNLEKELQVEHQTTVDMWKQKLQESEQRIVEMETEKLEYVDLADKLHDTEMKLEDSELRCAQLETKITDLDNIIQTSKEVVTEYELKIAEITKKITELEVENREAVSLEFEFQRHRNKSQLREFELLEAIKEKDSQIGKLEKSCEHLSAERLQTSKENLTELSQSQVEVVCIKCQDLERILDENKRLEGDYARIQIEVRQLQFDLDQSGKEGSELQQKLLELNEASEQKLNEFKKLESQLEESRNECNELKQKEETFHVLSIESEELKKHLDSLQKASEEKLDEFKKLESQLEESRNECNELKKKEETFHILSIESEELKRHLDSLQHEFNDKLKETEILRNAVDESKTECVELKQKLKNTENLQVQLDDRIQECNTLKTQITEAEEELVHKLKGKEQLELQLKDSLKECDQLRHKANEVENLQLKLTESVELKQQLADDLNKKISEIETLESKLEDLRTVLADSETGHNPNDSLLKEMDSLHAEKNKLKEEKEAFAKEIEREKHDLLFEQELFQKQIDETKMQLENYERTNFDLTFEKDNLFKECEGLNSENRTLHVEYEKMIAECQSLRTDCEKIQQQYNTIYSQYDEMITENDKLKGYCEHLKTHNDELQNELAEVKEKIEMIQEKLTADDVVADNLVEIQMQLERINTENDELNVRYQETVVERESLQKAYNLLETQMNECISENKTIQIKYDDLEREFKSTSEQNDILQKEIDSLLLVLDELRVKFENIQRMYNEKTDNLLEDNNDRRKLRIKELIIEERVLISEMQVLQERNSCLRSSAAEVSEVFRLRLEIEQLQTKQVALVNELAALTNEYQCKDHLQECSCKCFKYSSIEMNSLQQKLTEVENSFNDLQAEYDTASTELMDNLQENEILKSKCSALEAELKKRKLPSITEMSETESEMVQSLRNDIVTYQSEVKKLTKENGDLHLVIKTATSNANEVIADNNLLRENAANVKLSNEEYIASIHADIGNHENTIAQLKHEIEVLRSKPSTTPQNETLLAELNDNRQLIKELKNQIAQLYALKELNATKANDNRIQDFCDNLPNLYQIEILLNSLESKTFTSNSFDANEKGSSIKMLLKNFETISIKEEDISDNVLMNGEIKDIHFELSEIEATTVVNVNAKLFEKTIEEMSKKLDEMTSQMLEVQTKHDDKDRIAKDQFEDIRKLQTEIQTIETERNGLSAKVRKLEIENESLIEQTSVIEKLERSNKELEKLKTNFEDKLQKAYNDAKVSTERIAELGENLDSVSKAKQEVLDKLTEIERHAQRSYEELKATERKVLQLEEEKSNLVEERDSLSGLATALAQLESDKKALSTDLQSALMKVLDSERQLQSLQTEQNAIHTSLTKQIAELEKENSSLLIERNELISNRSDNIEELGRMISEMEQQSKEISDKYERLQQEYEQVCAQILEANNEIQVKSNRISDLMEIEKSTADTLSSLQSTVEKLKVENSSLREKLAVEMSNSAKTNDLCRENERMSADLKMQNSRLQEELETVRKPLQELLEDNQKLKTNISEMESKDNKFQKLILEFEKRNSSLVTEKKSLQDQLKSQENEKNLKIAELEKQIEIEQRRAETQISPKVEFSPKRAKIIESLVGENNNLKLKNQELFAELDAAQRSSQSERRSKRHSTHDERRRQSLWDCSRNASTMTDPTDKLCNCEELNEKLIEIKKKLIIRECQVNTLTMEQRSNPLKDELKSLKVLMCEGEERQQQMRYEIKKLRMLNQERSICTKCVAQSKRVFNDCQTQTPPSQPTCDCKSSSVVVKAESDKDESYIKEHNRLKVKYEDLKQICRGRYVRIKHLEDELAKGKENENGNNILPNDSKQLIDGLKKELKSIRTKYEEVKFLCNSRSDEIKKYKQRLGIEIE